MQSNVVVRARAKAGKKPNNGKVDLNLIMLGRLYHLRQEDAAKKLVSWIYLNLHLLSKLTLSLLGYLPDKPQDSLPSAGLKSLAIHQVKSQRRIGSGTTAQTSHQVQNGGRMSVEQHKESGFEGERRSESCVL